MSMNLDGIPEDKLREFFAAAHPAMLACAASLKTAASTAGFDRGTALDASCALMLTHAAIMASLREATCEQFIEWARQFYASAARGESDQAAALRRMEAPPTRH
jgi:hypothetical protein